MTRDNKNQLIQKYGIENVVQILLDNERRIYYSDLAKDGKVTFDDTIDCILTKEQIGTGHYIVSTPYEFIQSIIFKDPTPSSTF